MSRIWIFSNNYEGYYKDSDWDTSSILKIGHYYFKTSESNRSKVEKGDFVFLREYGAGFWATCMIDDNWVDDPDAQDKHGIDAGWFPIADVKRWKVTLPYEVIRSELSNQNHRLRIAKATQEDKNNIELARRIWVNLGYGDPDESFFILESGIEEAIKTNLSQLKLTLASEDIQQQCNLGIGVGRTDLICVDEDGNYVVIELKAVQTSDQAIGQVLRYMGFVRENWAKPEGKDVKGIILTPSYDEQLRLAANEAGIRVLRLRIV